MGEGGCFVYLFPILLGGFLSLLLCHALGYIPPISIPPSCFFDQNFVIGFRDILFQSLFHFPFSIHILPYNIY